MRGLESLHLYTKDQEPQKLQGLVMLFLIFLPPVDTDTKVLSDFDEKMHRLEEHLLERPEPARVINNVQSLSPEGVYSFDVLNVFSHAHDMRGALGLRICCAE